MKIWGKNEGRDVKQRFGPKRNSASSSQVIYEADSSLSPTAEVVVSSGSRGFTIDVYRDITHAASADAKAFSKQPSDADSISVDGRKATEKWTQRYYPAPKVVRVHPCRIPGGPTCPTSGGGGTTPPPIFL